MARPRQPLVYGGRVTLEGDMQIATLHIDSPLLYRAALKHYAGHRVTITIAPEEQTRSLQANRYLFGVVYALAIPALFDAGFKHYTKEELHHLFKERHNPITVVDFDGVEKRIGGSTKKLSVEDFGIFIEHTMVDLATMAGVSFPEPRKTEDWRKAAALLSE